MTSFGLVHSCFFVRAGKKAEAVACGCCWLQGASHVITVLVLVLLPREVLCYLTSSTHFNFLTYKTLFLSGHCNEE